MSRTGILYISTGTGYLWRSIIKSWAGQRKASGVFSEAVAEALDAFGSLLEPPQRLFTLGLNLFVGSGGLFLCTQESGLGSVKAPFNFLFLRTGEPVTAAVESAAELPVVELV